MKFPTKKEALAYLSANPLSYALWDEGKIEMSAIYWNGRCRIQRSDASVNRIPEA